jgi:hypothetical protein
MLMTVPQEDPTGEAVADGEGGTVDPGMPQP